MTGAESLARVAMEELVEEDEVTPSGIRRISCIGSVDRASAVLIREEDRDESALDLVRDFSECAVGAGAGGTLDFERFTVEVVVALEGFDQQVIEREPDRATPIRVA